MRRENMHLESYCRYVLLTRVRCGAGNVFVPLVNHKSAPLKCIVCLSVSMKWCFRPFSAWLLFCFFTQFFYSVMMTIFPLPLFRGFLWFPLHFCQESTVFKNTFIHNSSTFTSFTVILFKCIHICVHEYSVVVYLPVHTYNCRGAPEKPMQIPL